MLIDFNQLFTVQADVAIAKVPLLIPKLLWCRQGTRLRGVQVGRVDLVTLTGKIVEVREANGILILKNWFPRLPAEERI